MSIEIIIDPNVRIEEKRTYAGFEDVVGGFVNDLQPGDAVTVVEEESDYIGSATVFDIDVAKQLVYLTVDWRSLHPRSEGTAGDRPLIPLVRAQYLTSYDTDVTVTSSATMDLAHAG